ncbi:MAG: sigma-70 family RNA polymerase sigma factor [Pseudomonadota bacterium]
MGDRSLCTDSQTTVRSLDGARVGADIQDDMPKAVSDLYVDYADQLSQAIRRTFGDGPPDPDDVAQHAFEKLIQRGNLDKITNLKGFLWRTARNIVLAAKRSANVRNKYDFEIEHIYFALKDNESTPERIIIVREQLELIRKVLLDMPDKRRRAIVMHRVEGLSMTEIGRRLGMTRQSVALHITKGIAELDVAFLTDGERSPL